jgi:hypothetical protein
MKFKRLFLLAIGAVFLLTSAGKPIATANEIGEIKENVTQKAMRLANLASDEEETEDPKEIFSRAIEDYKEEFDDYINVTALNVIDKENVTLPDFDINYVAPTYGEVMHEYQLNLEASLTSTQLKKYDDLRRADFTFDKYVALNQNKYLDLTVPPKYEHVTTMAVVTTALVGILSSAGLTQAAISAFTGAVGTLSAAISTSWIPFIGWVLAVGLAVGALIALTVIIVQYWDEICSVINDIKNWFLEQFSAFGDLIDSYFNDAVAQGEKSKIDGREKIGGKDITWISKVVKTAAGVTFLDLLRRVNNLAVLMRNVKKYYDLEDGNYYISYWEFEELVSTDFVKDYNVYDLGVSTYTWYNNTARQLMMGGTTLLENLTYNELGKPYEIGYHNFLKTEERTLNGFNHYHVFEYQELDDNGVYGYDEVKKGSIRKAHSFFGLMYFRWPNGSIETFPTNP